MSLFSDLADSIGNQFKDALGSVFGASASGQTYPTAYNSITNKPSYTDGAWKRSSGYSFKVVRAVGNKLIENPAKDWKEFTLQINPQEMSQDEVFAIQVTPTLRGILVEHQGSTFKDIIISGTTGISPNRREGGADRNGNPILAKGHSGYEEFHELRSYFRAYVEAKRQDTESGTLRMIFHNKRDAEQVFVEPQKFSMKRSATKPFSYDYTIALKGIGIPENAKSDVAGLTPLERINQALDLFNYANQVVVGSIGLLRRTERDIEDTILNPLRSITQMLNSIKGGKSTFFGDYGITRRAMQNFQNEIGRVESNFNDLLGKNLASYNMATGRTSTLVGESGRQSTYQELKILNAFSSMKKANTLLVSEVKFFEKDNQKAVSDAQKSYVKRTTGADGNSTTVPGDLKIQTANSVRTVPIGGNDTVQIIAARELGNPDRFKDIVILNNLKYPYIDAAGGSGVLRPGDQILIPSSQSSDSNTGVRMNVEYEITKNLEHVEKILGVDLRLSSENDLVFANFGDYDLVAGIDNMAQAVALKIAYEKGSLKRHPEIGAGLQIGTKSRNLNDIREALSRSLESDPRMQSVPFIEATQENNTIMLNMVLKIKNVAQPVPVSLEASLG
jgi:hypothetical protein